MDDRKLDGVGAFSSFGPKYLGEPVFEHLLEDLNKRSAVAHLHLTVAEAMQSLELNFMRRLFAKLPGVETGRLHQSAKAFLD